MEGYFEIGFFVLLFLVGFFAGRWNEKRHYISIRKREKELAGVLIFSNRFPPSSVKPMQSQLVSGSVVISEDYFKNLMGGLYNLFGGRMKSYESLIDRARRESVLRMKQEARYLGSSMIINVKFQTFAIGGRSENNIRGVELLVYGTSLAPLRA